MRVIIIGTKAKITTSGGWFSLPLDYDKEFKDSNIVFEYKKLSKILIGFLVLKEGLSHVYIAR